MALALVAAAVWLISMRRRLGRRAGDSRSMARRAGRSAGGDMLDRVGLLTDNQGQSAGELELEAAGVPGLNNSGASWRLRSRTLQLQRADFEFKTVSSEESGEQELVLLGSGFSSVASTFLTLLHCCAALLPLLLSRHCSFIRRVARAQCCPAHNSADPPPPILCRCLLACCMAPFLWPSRFCSRSAMPTSRASFGARLQFCRAAGIQILCKYTGSSAA